MSWYFCFNRTKPPLLWLVLQLTLVAGCSTTTMSIPPHTQKVTIAQQSGEAANLPEESKPGVERIRFPALEIAEWPEGDEVKWEALGLKEEPVSLNVENMPLNRFIQVSLGDVLGLSFYVDPEVQGREDTVTLRVSRAMAPVQLLETLESLLSGFGVGLALTNSTLSVMPVAKMDAVPPSFVGTPQRLAMQRGKVMTIVPLKYATYGDILRFSRHFISLDKDASVELLTRTNSIVIVGEASKVARFIAVIELLDQPAISGRRIEIFQPVFWQVEDIIDLLKDALTAQGITIADSPTAPGLYLSQVKTLNGMIVAAHDESLLKWVENWITVIDRPEVAGDSLRSFVYPVQHSPAEDLGALVGELLTGGLPGSGKNSGGGTTGSGRGMSASGEGLRMVVDQAHNSLIFIGNAQAYESIYRLLGQIDKPAKQVLLEVTVADLTVDSSKALGVEWRFEDVNSDGVLDGVGNTLGGLGVGNAGFSYSVLDDEGDIRARLNALETKGDAKILSSPRLLAVDNEEARIQVGTQIAIVSSETTSDSVDGIIRSFNYVDTGIILNFTPTVMAGDQVRLRVSQEVSVPGASSNNTPPINTRSVETTLVAESGATIMIGGLISSTDTLSDEQVPLLGDMPILGALFRGRQVIDSRTEMVVLITPHIIESSSELESITEAFRGNLGW